MNLGYLIQISKKLEDAEWNKFVTETPGGHHVQTSLWAMVKASLGWKSVRLIVKDKNQIIAGSQMLIRGYPVIGSAGYVAKGPLCKTEDPELADFLIKQILNIGRKHRCQLVAVQPPNNSHYMSQLLIDQDFRRSSLELAPVASILIDLSPDLDQIFSQVKRQTRQNIKRSRNKGITICEGTEHDLDFFYILYLRTSKRQKFRPYPKFYFEIMRRTLESHGHFQLLLAKFDNQPISAVLLVPYQDTVIIKILGWSGLYREFRPNEALFWGAVEWAKSHGYLFLDLEGIDPVNARRILQGESSRNLVSRTPDQLKYGFGGNITFFPEAYDYVFNPIYRKLYYRLKPQVAKQSIISKSIDFFRKR